MYLFYKVDEVAALQAATNGTSREQYKSAWQLRRWLGGGRSVQEWRIARGLEPVGSHAWEVALDRNRAD